MLLAGSQPPREADRGVVDHDVLSKCTPRVQEGGMMRHDAVDVETFCKPGPEMVELLRPFRRGNWSEFVIGDHELLSPNGRVWRQDLVA